MSPFKSKIALALVEIILMAIICSELADARRSSMFFMRDGDIEQHRLHQRVDAGNNVNARVLYSIKPRNTRVPPSGPADLAPSPPLVSVEKPRNTPVPPSGPGDLAPSPPLSSSLFFNEKAPQHSRSSFWTWRSGAQSPPGPGNLNPGPSRETRTMDAGQSIRTTIVQGRKLYTFFDRKI